VQVFPGDFVEEETKFIRHHVLPSSDVRKNDDFVLVSEDLIQILGECPVEADLPRIELLHKTGSAAEAAFEPQLVK
jgi:hypothetical protein